MDNADDGRRFAGADGGAPVDPRQHADDGGRVAKPDSGQPAEPNRPADDARRVALVTGGGSGIGRAIALDFAAHGIDTVIVGRRLGPLRETAAAASGPGRILVQQGDVTVSADRSAAVELTFAQFGGLDVLVNNAGVTAMSPLLDYTEEEWDRDFATHVKAAFFLTQAAVPVLRESAAPRVVNIGSVFGSFGLNNDLYGDKLPWTTPSERGDRGPIREVAYSATKGAVLQLTRELATALAPWGILVNSVTPGFIPVPANPLAPEIQSALAQAVPLRRVGRPEEIAVAVRFLASAEATYITGAELRVDGGFAAW